jgi:two-component system response regulator MprA
MLPPEIGKKVLVVDDNTEARNSIKILLELIGLKVTAMEDGEEAIAEIKNQRYSLFIFDVTMPRIDGVELFQIVRNSENCRDVPVMFTSGFPRWTDPEKKRREIFSEADAYIQKPFNTEAFLETIRGLLKTRTSIA